MSKPKQRSSMVSGDVDTYEGYRKLFVIYCSNSAALEEIKPMFRIPNIAPDGVFSVTPAFREEVRTLAAKLLPLLSNWDATPGTEEVTQGKAKPGEMVILTGLPSGFVDDLPPEDQKAITESIGQPVSWKASTITAELNLSLLIPRALFSSSILIPNSYDLPDSALT